MGQNCRGGGAIARHIVGLGGGFLQQLHAHILIGILQFDLFGNGNAVVGDGGSAELLVQCHVAALGAQSRDHSIRQDVHSQLQAASRFFCEYELFSHSLLSPSIYTRI